ncbi:MAG: flagellin [Deltaproteobacteria bacterium]|nr:flagellin [Deltaproteobacteria bacterium]
MAFNINDKILSQRLQRYLSKARKNEGNSLAKLASGTIFVPEDPHPAERAIAEKMEYKVRALAASKRNVNDALSLLQTAESSMSEISNMITRMKEINIAAASTTVSDQERRYLFIEYEALHDEINRVSMTTEFNGIPLLNGSRDDAPETLIFRVGDPVHPDEGFLDSDDINSLRLENFQSIDTTSAALGIQSAADLLAGSDEEEGISLEDVEEMLLPENEEAFATIYDQAVTNLSTQRALFGGLQSRLHRSLDYIDVYQENIAAAKSRISDTDYASEVTNMIQEKIKATAATSLLAQSNLMGSRTLQLLNSIN